MKIILITLVIIVIAVTLLFLYCALVLAKRADNITYKDQIILDETPKQKE